jgi:hypothetical protein
MGLWGSAVGAVRRGEGSPGGSPRASPRGFPRGSHGGSHGAIRGTLWVDSELLPRRSQLDSKSILEGFKVDSGSMLNRLLAPGPEIRRLDQRQHPGLNQALKLTRTEPFGTNSNHLEDLGGFGVEFGLNLAVFPDVKLCKNLQEPSQEPSQEPPGTPRDP